MVGTRDEAVGFLKKKLITEGVITLGNKRSATICKKRSFLDRLENTSSRLPIFEANPEDSCNVSRKRSGGFL